MRREVQTIKFICIFNKQKYCKKCVVNCRTSAMLSRYGQVYEDTTNIISNNRKYEFLQIAS